MGNFSSLNIGMTALRAFKSYQDIIGNNIANVSNKNYKRRDGVLEPLRVSDSVYGGVDLVRIKRTVDYFAERDVRNSVSDYEKNNYMYHIFSKLEGKINVLDDSSVYSALSSFWEALDELSKTPSDITLKNSCVSKGKNLCVSIKNVIDNNLRTEQDIFNTAQNDIKLINNKLKQIADLNQKIIETETIGLESNSLRDARDGILEELSEYFDFDMIEDKNGYRISVNGISVVNGKEFYEIKAEISGGAYKKIDYSIPKYNQNISFSLGKLSAYADSIKEIGDINSSFDKIIKSLVSTEPESINYIHRNGYDSNGNLSGKDFFVLNSKGELDINPDIVSDPSLFAASKQPYSLDGGNVSDMADALKSPKIEGKSYFEFLSEISSLIGFKSQNYKYDTDTSLEVKNQALNRRDSVSGISVDEEMVKLMEMQKAYSTMAKYMISVNEALDELINIIR